MLKFANIHGRRCIRISELIAFLARVSFRGDIQKARVWLDNTLGTGWKRDEEICLRWRKKLYLSARMAQQVLAWRLQELKKANGGTA